MKHFFRRLFACILLATLAACGGGGSASAPAEVAVKTTGFTPALAVTGETVTLNGVGFKRITSVLFGAAPAQYTVVSDTQLTARATTPPAANLTGQVAELATTVLDAADKANLF